ncbi:MULTISPECIES: hypothetical protein [Bacillus cereus group]|uniref:hypothetical protein n=1 Tax=Bacillus cereus group TaxID=86661 RepID=UPI000446053A|nr:MULTISPECIES: hypothetical protein [Bacillus cereus group]EXY10132.1 hypothetical protein BF15_00925 [Bacillus thuringiensis]MEB8634327.1 hypothetical protein [Bacillus cereus]MEB8743749.1 hypothetical protein [Bacillus cereus]MEB8800029.1 hypothetical protein [Bacillus cereus]MEB8811670.1 hypothetical protein [Bacillus cereus]
MKEISELEDRLRNEMVTRMDDSDIVDILVVLEKAEEEIDGWKQSHNKLMKTLVKTEHEHRKALELLQKDANKTIKEWERISNKQVEHLTRNGKEIIGLTEAYFDTLVYLSTLEDIDAVHKAIKDIVEDKQIS